jgi:hypothetical protein
VPADATVPRLFPNPARRASTAANPVCRKQQWFVGFTKCVTLAGVAKSLKRKL